MLLPVPDSKSLSHCDLFVLSRGLATLRSRFRPPRISHKRTLHLCKAMPTACRPDLKVPYLHWIIGMFGNPDSCRLQFSSVLPNHLQQTLRVDQPCHWCRRLWCRLLCRRHSTAASCSSWQLQINWFGTCRFPSFHPRHSDGCNTCSATTLILCVPDQMY